MTVPDPRTTEERLRAALTEANDWAPQALDAALIGETPLLRDAYLVYALRHVQAEVAAILFGAVDDETFERVARALAVEPVPVPPLHPDDGHEHRYTCVRCGVDPSPAPLDVPEWVPVPNAFAMTNVPAVPAPLDEAIALLKAAMPYVRDAAIREAIAAALATPPEPLP
jgi:hypothetical protein